MKHKITKKQQRLDTIVRLEREGRFDVDYLPKSDNFILPDSDFKFVRTNIFYRMACIFCRTVTFLFGPILCWLVYGLKIRGKRNIKGVKGAICVCNHVSILDTLFVKQAVGHYRSYHTGDPHNNRKGLGGYILRRAGFLSLGGSFGAQKNFAQTLEYLFKRGAIVNFYPEEALWQGYEKPRPLKIGAFKYAARFNVPVIPLFVTYEGKRRRTVVNIMPPVYPDADLSLRDNARKMCDECYEVWRGVYERVYGKPLQYDCAATDAIQQ